MIMSKVKVGKSGRNAGFWVVRDALKNEQEFTNSPGSFRGTHGAPGFWQTGQLPEEYCASVRRADYTIYSYSTPIAWHTDGVWHMPPLKYSLTTTGHQHSAFTAISQLSDGAE